MARFVRLHRVLVLVLAVLLALIVVGMLTVREESRAIYGGFMDRSGNKVNLRKMLIASVQAAQRGGAVVADVANSRQLAARSKGKTAEGVNDPVTLADSRSHCIMKNGLGRVFPRVRLYSEEDAEQCNGTQPFDLDPTVLGIGDADVEIADRLVDTDDVTVWIDPLDATKEFTEGLYEYVTTMVCVAVKGVPVIGVIHNPFTEQTAWTYYAEAASSYVRRIYESRKPIMAQPVFIISRSHAGTAADFIAKTFGKTAEVSIAAGAGYKVLQVVANNASIYLHKTAIKKWDICAGDAILRHFGGTMTTLANEPIDYGAEAAHLNEHGLLATLNHHQTYANQITH